MAKTTLGGQQITDGSVQRSDLDVSTIGQAVVRKIVQGSGIGISSDGADAGTGDVTVSAISPTLTGDTTATAGSSVTVTHAMSQDVAFTGILSPPQITSNINDYSPSGFSTAGVIRLYSDASRSITGLSGGVAGKMIIIQNIGSFTITLNNSNSSSASANRFDIIRDEIIPPSGVIILFYDATSTRWRSHATHYHDGAEVYTGTVLDARLDSNLTGKTYNKWTLTTPTTSATLVAGADGLTYTFPPITTNIGYKEIPQNSQSAAYTAVLTDAGKHILHPSADVTARTYTIPANSSVAYPIGTALTFVNQNGAGIVTIAITTDTMRLAGAGTTGSRTLAANGVATVIKLTSTEWIISGVGLT